MTKKTFKHRPLNLLFCWGQTYNVGGFAHSGLWIPDRPFPRFTNIKCTVLNVLPIRHSIRGQFGPIRANSEQTQKKSGFAAPGPPAHPCMKTRTLRQGLFQEIPHRLLKHSVWWAFRSTKSTFCLWKTMTFARFSFWGSAHSPHGLFLFMILKGSEATCDPRGPEDSSTVLGFS